MQHAYPTLSEATKVWAKIAMLSFGGPAGQIAVMHRILVEEKRWLGDERFLHALNFCMLLPGPEAQQLATYIGWLMHGVRGALVAGLLFIAPGMIAIMGLSWIYAGLGDVSIVVGLFFGLKAAVLAIVVQALIRVAKRTLRNHVMLLIAMASFVAILLFAVPFPIIILCAALMGWIGARSGITAFNSYGGHGAGGDAHVADKDTLLGADLSDNPRKFGAFSAAIGALVLWLLPVALLVILASDTVFAEIAVFFSKLAVLTFGGAYAVLGWVAQDAVVTYGWIAPGEMLDGLGMAETTPGPLIMVLQFVGFMAAFRDSGWMTPLLAGTAGGLITTWVTFAPCFAWIFLGAPVMERLRRNASISAALKAVTAAVVGVILNLAIWFAVHVFWREVIHWHSGVFSIDLPVWSSLNLVSAGLSLLALLALFRFKLSVTVVLAGAAVSGIFVQFVGLV